LGLHGIYFEGNAPATQPNSLGFPYDSPITVYYREGTTGWGETFAEIPTRALGPGDFIIDKNFRIRDGKFSATLVGPSSATLVVEACADLANPVWTPVSTNNLAQGEHAFTDPGPARPVSI
jgi:hypothetical protein